MKVVHVFSGGLDSTVLLTKLLNERHNVRCINFYYGSKHNAKERDAAREICGYYRVKIEFINLDFISELFKSDLLNSGGEIPEGHYESENMKKTVVPFRNGIMLSIAIGYAESIGYDAVTIGAHTGDHTIYPDCRAAFLQSMYEAAKYGTWKGISVLSPWKKIDKTEIVNIGRRLDVPFHLTWTCYKGDRFHCGKCGACIERKEALGGDDPTVYEEENNV